MSEYLTVGWLIARLQNERHPDDVIQKFMIDDKGWTIEVPFGGPGGPLAVGDPVTVNKGSITEYDAVVVPQSEKIPPGEVNVMEVGSGSVATRRLGQLTRREVRLSEHFFQTPCWCRGGQYAHERESSCGPTEAR
jgi:hypothetical protein